MAALSPRRFWKDHGWIDVDVGSWDREVYHMIHTWWSANISLKTLKPLFEERGGCEMSRAPFLK